MDVHLQEAPMPVNLSIKGVSDNLADQLRARAARHHRSLQGELMVILEESVNIPRRLSPAELLEKIRALGLRTPAESAKMIRKERDERSRG
jgi:plasmid stability protein